MARISKLLVFSETSSLPAVCGDVSGLSKQVGSLVLSLSLCKDSLYNSEFPRARQNNLYNYENCPVLNSTSRELYLNINLVCSLFKSKQSFQTVQKNLLIRNHTHSISQSTNTGQARRQGWGEFGPEPGSRLDRGPASSCGKGTLRTMGNSQWH